MWGKKATEGKVGEIMGIEVKGSIKVRVSRGEKVRKRSEKRGGQRIEGKKGKSI